MARLGNCGECPLCLISLLLRGTNRTPVGLSGRSCARVAERQTRWLQVPVSERAWGFKSPLAHADERAPVFGPGFFFISTQAEGIPGCADRGGLSPQRWTSAGQSSSQPG